MEIFWILLTVSLTIAEKLDRTYLPPHGSAYSGGSPGAINVPLELPKNIYSSNDKGISKTPDLAIGINRVNHNKIDDTEDISTHKPKITYNINSFNHLTNPTASFTPSSPFPKEEEDSILITTEKNNFADPSDDFHGLLQMHKIEKHPRTSIFDEINRVYLPSYGENDTDNLFSITIPPPVNYENSTSDDKYIQPETGSYNDKSLLNPNYQQLNVISSTMTSHPNNDNSNIRPYNDHSSDAAQFSATTLISPTKGEAFIFNHMGNQIPERIQSQVDRQAVILNYDQSRSPEGYTYSYDTSNGIHSDEEGSAINGVKAKGSYSYMGDDGNVYQVEYTADENGFVPKGSHLPTAPPIPDAILKVIEQALKDKEAGIYDDGSYNEQKYGYKNLQERYPEATIFIKGTSLQPEIVRNIQNSYTLSNDYEDSRTDNKEEKPLDRHGNELNDFNFIKNNENYDNNDLNYGKDISPSQNIALNDKLQDPSLKSEHSQAALQPGYKYFPPQFNDNKKKSNSFPLRFSGNYEDSDQERSDNNTEKLSVKPFLTPYVTRKDAYSEITDYDEQLGKDPQDTDFGEQPYGGKSGENYWDDLNSSDDVHFGNKSKYQGSNGGFNNIPIGMYGGVSASEFIPGDNTDQPLYYGDRLHNANHPVPSENNGYVYQNAHKPFFTLNSRVSYTTSTAAPTIIPTGVNHNNGIGPSPFETTSFSSIVQLIDTTTRLPTDTKSQVIIDSNNESESVYPNAYSNIDTLSTPQTLQTSRPTSDDTRFAMPYRPTTESSEYTDLNKVQPSTINNIGEDFTGPKQPPRFDPITGYHY